MQKDFQKIYKEGLKKYLNRDGDTAPYDEFMKWKLTLAMEGKLRFLESARPLC